MSKVQEIAKKINGAWKAEVLTAGDLIPECKRFSIGTLGGDYALYGGLPEGKLTVYSGESQSAKSLTAALAAANYQKQHPDKIVIYVDVEETLIGQVEFMQRMTGLDLSAEHFLRYDCCGKSAEEIFQDIIELQKADDIGLIIIDSAPMLISQADIDNEITKDNGQRASIAKSMGKFLKFMVPMMARRGNPMIILNHLREAGKTFTGAKLFTEPCGYALNFYACQKVRFAARKYTNGDKLDLSTSQSNEADGFCVTFSVTKNRLGPCNRNGAKIIFRYDSGIDTLTDLFEIITKFEIAKKLSSVTWLLVDPATDKAYVDAETGEELKFAGKGKMLEYLKSHPEFTEMYSKAVNDFINHTSDVVSLIDEDSLKEIQDLSYLDGNGDTPAAFDENKAEEEELKSLKAEEEAHKAADEAAKEESSSESEE